MGELGQDIATAVVLGLVAYASTNVDNLLLLCSIRRGSNKSAPIRFGFLAATLGVLTLSLCFIALGFFIPTNALGYLGIVPITLGAKQILFSPAPETADGPAAVSAGAVAAILFSNSSDTLAAFGPLFVESEPVVVVTLVATFLVCASAVLVVVERLQDVISEMPWLDTLATRGTPFIMILVGSYILMDTATDLV